DSPAAARRRTARLSNPWARGCARSPVEPLSTQKRSSPRPAWQNRVRLPGAQPREQKPDRPSVGLQERKCVAWKRRLPAWLARQAFASIIYHTGTFVSPVSRDAHMLELRGVAKFYGKTEALQPTDLRIAAHQTTVLLGPSGCGKSTLLR